MKKMNPLEWILTGILAIILVISTIYLVKETHEDMERGFTCSESVEIQHNHPLY